MAHSAGPRFARRQRRPKCRGSNSLEAAAFKNSSVAFLVASADHVIDFFHGDRKIADDYRKAVANFKPGFGEIGLEEELVAAALDPEAGALLQAQLIAHLLGYDDTASFVDLYDGVHIIPFYQ